MPDTDEADILAAVETICRTRPVTDEMVIDLAGFRPRSSAGGRGSR